MKTNLLSIPYVGKSIKQDLMYIGIFSVEDLKGKNSEELYFKICKYKKFTEDWCLLYAFRMAIYYAENKPREEEKIKWWYWKDKEYNRK